MHFPMVESLFQMRHRQIPEGMQWIGSYPEENPTHFILEVTCGEIIENYVVQVNSSEDGTPGSLVCAPINSQEELEAIKLLKTNSIADAEDKENKI